MKTSELIRKLAHSPVYREAGFMCVALGRCASPHLWAIPQELVITPEQENVAVKVVMGRIHPWHSLQQYLAAERGGHARDYTLVVRTAWFDDFANELEAKGQ